MEETLTEHLRRAREAAATARSAAYDYRDALRRRGCTPELIQPVEANAETLEGVYQYFDRLGEMVGLRRE